MYSMIEKNESKDDAKMVWTIDSGILNNMRIMKQVFWSVLLSIIFVLTIILLIEVFDPYSTVTADFFIVLGKIFLILAGILTFCILIGVGVIMGNSYQYTFTINDDGIHESAGKKQRSKNAIVNMLLMVGGIFTKSPGLVGAGVLAQSNQNRFVSWKDIDKIEVDSRKKSIILKKKNRTLMIVFCTPQNFKTVQSTVKKHIVK